MIIIAKLLLIFLLFATLIFYFTKMKSERSNRIIFILLILIGVIFVAYPEITNRIAHLIGISRGADLIFYLSIIFFFFAVLLLYAKNKELERKLNELVKNDAIENVRE